MNSKEYNRQYYLKNREKMLQNNKQWRQNNPEQFKQNWKEWAAKNNIQIKITQRNWRMKDGLGVYGLWNKIDSCWDRVGEGQLKQRLQNYQNTHSKHPQQINDNVEKYGFDNVYDFVVLCQCETKEECQRIETEYINKLNPKYNELKYQY